MRILLLNPNMSTSMTEQMTHVARRTANKDVEIVPTTATRGFPYISSRAEAQIGGALALEMIAEHEKHVDAVVIAAFGDPGLKAARELFNLPIVGMAEASLITASLIGERFSIVTFTPAMSRWYLDSVSDSGLTARFAGVRTPAANTLDAFASQESMADVLHHHVTRCIVDDGADVVILGGAPLAGMAFDLQPSCAALLLDPISAAVAQATLLANLTTKTAYRNRHFRPVAKTSVDLSPPLAECILNTETS